MTKKKDLSKNLFSSKSFSCRGLKDDYGTQALSRDNAVTITRETYRDGKSRVSCPFIYGGSYFECLADVKFRVKRKLERNKDSVEDNPPRCAYC
tara:strand:- start:26081 stop:26362 length:282 start_codon:yes stop_codon:yes gene_type:complete